MYIYGWIIRIKNIKTCLIQINKCFKNKGLSGQMGQK